MGPGVLSDSETSNPFFEQSGFITLTVRADRVFTGRLLLQGKTHSFSCRFEPDGRGYVIIPRKGQADLAIWLRKDVPAPGVISGRVISGGMQLSLEALQAGYGGKHSPPHPMEGRHTSMLPAPDSSLGNGYAAQSVNDEGCCKLVGKLADGTKVTASAYLVDPGGDAWQLPVHAFAYVKSSGLLWGNMLFQKIVSDETSDIAGELEWFRPDNAKLGHAGFLKTVQPAGKRYLPPDKGISFLGGTPNPAEFLLAFGSDLHGTPGIWPPTNKPLLIGPLPGNLKFIALTGVVRGSLTELVEGKPVAKPYEGVVFTHPLLIPGGATPLRGAGFSAKGSSSVAVEIRHAELAMEL